MSRRTMPEAQAAPSLNSIVWLAVLMVGVAVGVVLLYHFVLSSRSGPFPSSRAIAAEMPTPAEPGLGDAHAEALREAMGATKPE